jgi:vacuolar-type H+-ATPase subunit I/STV1
MKVSHIPPFGVRMPPDLKEKIDMASKQSGRSMNAEIVYRLQQSFENPSKQSGSETGSASEDHRISSSDSRKLKGLLSRMLDMVEMAEQDEAREAVEENEAYDRRSELDEKTEQSKGNESADERYKDNPEWGRFK